MDEKVLELEQLVTMAKSYEGKDGIDLVMVEPDEELDVIWITMINREELKASQTCISKYKLEQTHDFLVGVVIDDILKSCYEKFLKIGDEDNEN